MLLSYSLLASLLVQAKFDFESCSSNEVKTLNRDPSLCTKITSSCLEEMTVGGISPDCLKELSGKCVENIKKKTLEEIAVHKDAKIPARASLIRQVFTKLNMEKEKYEPLRRSMARDGEVMGEFFRVFKDDSEKQVIMLAPEYVKEFTGAACTHLQERSLKEMDSLARAKMSADCISHIPSEAFKAFKPDTIRELDEKACNGLRAGHVEALSKEALESIRVAQAKEWGVVPNLPEAKAERASFCGQHACSPVKKRLTDLRLPEDVKRALEQRCNPVWNKAVSLNATGGLIISAIVAMFFL